VDLRFLEAEPSADERAAVDDLLGPPPTGWQGGDRTAQDWHLAEAGHAWRSRRDELLPALHAVNDRVGWISPGALNYLCQRLTVPPADAYGVATFYSLFSMRPAPAHTVHLCTDIVCKAAGADAVAKALTEGFAPEGEERDGTAWHGSPCLGLCERAPAALAIEPGTPPRHRVIAPLRPEEAVQAARTPAAELPAEPAAEAAVPQQGEPSLRLLRRIGAVDPESLADYRSRGGYQALRTAVRLGPAGVIREVLDSGLVGRGGAAFPTGRKWEAVARQPEQPHYLVCNADESEPGTFKDRVVMEGDPFALIESMTIAGYATGCRKGFLYLRGEYPRSLWRLEAAIRQAREAGLLGPDVMGFGFAFDIEIRRGAGAYICGEETAIFGSIEGYRGEPRTKPPFPVERGLFGKPTVVNNVETLVNIPQILTLGGPAYAAIGSGASTGTKLFCVSGAVRRPGVYELPFGATLRELLELAGGFDGPPLRSVLLGGAAGSFLRPDQLDLPLTFEGARAAGATLGSGVVVALDDSTDMGAILLRIAGFFRDESCGQCGPCRVGTARQEEALARITSGRPRGSVREDVALLRDVGRAMRDASICGLGQTAWNAVESAIDGLAVFPELIPRTTQKDETQRKEGTS
jgi:NADH-quinone oxidoreductase subunit F